MRLLTASVDAPDLGTTELEAAYAIAADLPWHVRTSFICSADGAVSLDGSSMPLGGPGDRRLFGLLRDLSDLVLVGAGTARAERYRVPRPVGDRLDRRRRHGLPDAPALAVVSSRLDLDPADELFSTGRPILITHQGAPVERRLALARVADVLVSGLESVDLRGAAAQLRERGYRRVHCEGGPRLFRAALAAEVVHELCLTLAPLLTGPGAERIVTGSPLPAARRMSLVHTLTEDGYLFLRYALTGAAEATG